MRQGTNVALHTGPFGGQTEGFFEELRAREVERNARRFHESDHAQVERFSRALMRKVAALFIANLKRASLEEDDLDMAMAVARAVAPDGERDLDEVLHLYRGMEIADKAKARLAALIVQEKHTEAMIAYKPEREAYTLYDEARALEKGGDWKGAIEKYAAIGERFKESPVVERAARRTRICRVELAKAEKKE